MWSGPFLSDRESSRLRALRVCNWPPSDMGASQSPRWLALSRVRTRAEFLPDATSSVNLGLQSYPAC